jgi:polysaccharide export outer membrane protein
MRPSRLIPIVLAVFTAAGCAHTVPNGASASRDTTKSPLMTVAANLDSLVYERPTPPLGGPMQPTTTGTVAPMRASAQPVIPVPSSPNPPYLLDTGDKLRVVVFGQDGLTNSYFVDAAGQVTIPLIGAVTARGLTTQQLARSVAAKLRAGFIREPYVAIEVETYRPFFILGEVLQPGQYPYVPNMTVETAVAIAGGFTPRAYRYDVKLDRPAPNGTARARSSVPLLTRVQPGDTIVIKERWF